MKVLLKTYLTTDGCERLARSDDSLWYWYIQTVATHIDDGKGIKDLDAAGVMPAGVLLCEQWAGVPDLNTVRQFAVEGLHVEAGKIRSSAEQALTKIRGRIQDLLAVTDQRNAK